MKTIKINSNELIFLGDIHGNWNCIMRNDLTNFNIIQVGDYGIGYYPAEREDHNLRMLSIWLEKNNNFLYIIRGNHDDPDYFDGGDWLMYKNIYFLEDYTVLQNDKHNILCIGGAISVDREYSKKKSRIIGRLLWWKDEPFVLDEGKLNEIVENLKIDIVVTHTAPKCFNPIEFNTIVYNFAEDDPLLIQDLTKERNLVQKAYEILLGNGIQYWIYGHFHHSSREIIDNQVQAILLNIEEFYHLREEL